MSMEVQLRRFNSMERKPRMLKDFLSENPNSCSSSGFKSLPRTRRIPNGVVTLTNSTSSTSTFQTVINTIRNISFFTVRNSPSVLSLPRSLSRKLSSRRRRCQSCEIKTSTVKIKDIIRWKSFRDLQPSVPSPPLSPSDFNRYMTESSTAATTVTTTTTCSSSSSGGSSWSDGDFFTASWDEQNDGVEACKKVSFSPFVVGMDSVVAPFVGAKEDLTCLENEQHSPVSVLLVGEDEFLPFDQSLANINERRKQKFRQTVQKFESLAKFEFASLDQCLSLDENSYYEEEYEDDDDEEDQNVEEQEWVEERAKQLLHCVKATSSSVQSSCDDYLGAVLLDFFTEELSRNRNQNKNDEGFEWEILRIAEDWINWSFAYDDIVHVNKDGYIKDMDRRGGWGSFEEEKEELALEIEAAILHNLVADLLDLDG